MEENSYIQRFFAVVLLIMIVGLLGVGIARYFDSGNGTMTRSHTNCLTVGAGCGPIEHSIFHSFALPSVIAFFIGVSVFFFLLATTIVLNSAATTPEGPPPKFSIV